MTELSEGDRAALLEQAANNARQAVIALDQGRAAMAGSRFADAAEALSLVGRTDDALEVADRAIAAHPPMRAHLERIGVCKPEAPTASAST